MDGQPEKADQVSAAERAQWERAAKVREQHNAEARARQADRLAEAEAASASAEPGSTSKRIRVLAAAVAVVFLAGIGLMLVLIRDRSNEQPAWVAQLGLDAGASSGDQAPSRFSSSPTDESGVSSTAPSVATADQSLAPPPPSITTTGEDFDQIWRQIEVLEGWLLVHPASDRASDIYQSGTPPYADLAILLNQLRADHQTLRVEGYRILGVTVDARPSPDRVDLRYADTYTDRVTVDATGAVVNSEPYDGRARLWTVALQRGADDRWRVVETAFVSFGDVVPPG